MNRAIWIVNVNIFLYGTCWTIQSNTLPYLTQKLGADPVTFGYLLSTFGIIQTLGGLVFGRFGDLFGSDRVLVVAFIAAAMYYGLLSIAINIPILFLSCLPSVFMHAMQGGSMVITDLTNHKERASILGKVSLFYACGSVLGPGLGGYISTHYSNHLAAAVACLGSLLSVFLLVCFLPKVQKKEPHSPVPEDNSDQTAGPQFKKEECNILGKMTSTSNKYTEDASKALSSPNKMLQVINYPGVKHLLMTKVLTGLPSSIYSVMLPIVTMNTFKYTAQQNSYWQTYVAVLMMITQGFGVGFLTKRVSDQSLFKWVTFVFIWSYLFMSLSHTVAEMLVAMAPIIIGMALLSVIINSSLTQLVPSSDTGLVLAMAMACDALVGTVAPILGGFLLKSYGHQTFGCIGFVTSTIAFATFCF